MMRVHWVEQLLISVVVSVWTPGQAMAEDPQEQRNAPPVVKERQTVLETAEKEPALMSLTQELPDYSGDIWHRSFLAGDWGGQRTELAEKGITFDVDVTQIFHVNARGGESTDNGFRYSGSADYILILDTGRMGLWQAGQLLLKGETQFGQSINSKVGSLMSVNAGALFPEPDTHKTTLTQVVYTQFLSEKFGFAIGKIDYLGGDQNVFAHNETTQFLNMSFVANPIMAPLPYSALTAVVFYRPTDWLSVSLTALDSLGTASESGFETAFHSPEGTTFMTEWDVTIKPFGRPGHQRFGVAYTTQDLLKLDQNPRLSGVAESVGRQFGIIESDTKPDGWLVYYNFDQYFYTEHEDPTQGVGVFGRYGWSSGEANPFEAFYSIGIGGKGILPDRDHDTFGLGYYYLDMSDDLPSYAGLSSEQGIELYYEIEVTPWLHVTPDVQYIIDPGGGAGDDAIAVGIRTRMSF